jgi:hypothetical protein
MTFQSPGETPVRGSEMNVTMPPTNKGLLVAAGVCLLVPVVALMWVGSYAKETPKLGGIPFFFWYQFAWVFVTSAFTYTAHRLVIAARGQSGEPFAGHTADRGPMPQRMADEPPDEALGRDGRRGPGSPS